jgi:hypothetical protein
MCMGATQPFFPLMASFQGVCPMGQPLSTWGLTAGRTAFQFLLGCVRDHPNSSEIDSRSLFDLPAPVLEKTPPRGCLYGTGHHLPDFLQLSV